MPRRIFDELQNWAEGVNTSASADQLPPNASPRARNTFLKQIGAGSAVIGTRKGPITLNRTPITGSPGLIGGFQFKRKDGTNYTLLVSDTGRLDKLNVDNTTSVINATAFTSGTHYPIFEVANNFCFIVNDVNQKKTDGTTVYNVGMTRPAAPTATAVAGGAMAVGNYDVALTYFNSATGEESSRSDFTTVATAGANLQINVSWLAPADPQVTHVRVYIRFQSVGSNAYRAVAGATPAPDATYGGYIPATLATTLNISATQYGAFLLIAPNTTENNPPASGLQYPCFHEQRLFLADTANVYFSNIKDNVSYPESFNPSNVQPVNPGDGDTIVGLASYGGNLLVFKKTSIYYINGSDPNSWDVKLLTKDFGLSTMRSIVRAGGALYWWAGNLGPTVFKNDGAPVSLGMTFLADTISPDNLNQLAFASICGAVDEANQTVLWAIPETSLTRNTLVIPFSYQLGRFHSDGWNVFDIYSMWSMTTASKLHSLYVGGYAGQAFEWWSAGTDGVYTGTTTNGVVTSATGTTLTAAAASFDITGGGLTERYVYAISQDRLSIQRRRITSNTATVLTVTPAWDTNPNSTYTYVVGGINVQFDTGWMLSGLDFFKKRFEFLLLRASADTSVNIDVDLFVSMDLTAPKRTKTFTIASGNALYDATTSIYDTSLYGGSSVFYGKLRCATVGKAWRARLRYVSHDQPIVLNSIAMQGVPMSIKS